jgi:phage-related protein
MDRSLGDPVWVSKPASLVIPEDDPMFIAPETTDEARAELAKLQAERAAISGAIAKATDAGKEADKTGRVSSAKEYIARMAKADSYKLWRIVFLQEWLKTAEKA